MNVDLCLVRHVTLPELQGIANAPDVLPYIARNVNFLDMTPVYNCPGTLCLGYTGLSGCMLFVPNALRPGCLEMHYLAAGYGGLKIARASVDWVFTRTPTQAIFGFTPRENRAARLVNRWLGGSAVSECLDDGDPVIIYELTREQWASLQDEARQQNATHLKGSTT